MSYRLMFSYWCFGLGIVNLICGNGHTLQAMVGMVGIFVGGIGLAINKES